VPDGAIKLAVVFGLVLALAVREWWSVRPGRRDTNRDEPPD
jgi:hypothetical protein